MRLEFNKEWDVKVPKKETEKIRDKNKIKVNDKLIEFGDKINIKGVAMEGYFTPNKEAEKFLLKNPLAFLIAVILDQGIKAEKAWETPFEIKKRLGHFDVYKISETNDEEIIEIFNKKPKLHRFPKTMALRTKNACKLVIDKYQGNVENIWNDNPKSSELQNRFEEFEGVGQKKSSMATNILIRDLGVKSKDKSGIDISYDIHIRRIFLRTGLVEEDNKSEILNIAKKLNPEYPGVLDLPAWLIGRQWCHSINPNHNDCPLKEVCLKLDKNIKSGI